MALAALLGAALLGAPLAPLAGKARDCAAEATKVWEYPGGASEGMGECIDLFVKTTDAGDDPYLLIDAPLPAIQRVPLRTGLNGTLAVVPWDVSLSKSSLYPQWQHEKYVFNNAEWLLPPGYARGAAANNSETRIAFIHGGNAADSAVGPYYAGLTTRLANWTGLPVLSFDYPTEPVVPWPQNLRHVLFYLSYALNNGPDGPSRADKIILVSDSEGTLVCTQTVISLQDPALRRMLGFGADFPASTDTWLAGIVLSSAVVDIGCTTPSFAWNCYNFSDPAAPTPSGTGDPDTGNCTRTPDAFSKKDDCLWSYLEYFFGFSGVLDGYPRPQGLAIAETKRRADFFSQPTLTPLTFDLSAFPPLLLISATRDYFYSDGPTLHERACTAGADVESFNVKGAFHDFIEYSAGCGNPSGAMMFEALEAYTRIASFVARVTSPDR